MYNCSFVYLFQSKIEYDRLITSIGKKLPAEAGIKVRWRGGGLSLAQRRDFIQQLQSLTGDGPSLPVELNPKEFQAFHLAMLNKVMAYVCFVFQRLFKTFSEFSFHLL